MKPAIAKAAVIGAGSMGSGIAAQFANGGVPVVLLDIPAKEGPRNAYAEGGVERQLKAGGFMHPDRARLVTTGNTEDDLEAVADADLIVEAIIEELGAKQALYTRLEAVRRDGSIVSSNTSTIRLAALVEGQSARFKRDFVITHFFNPPRPMRLVEVLGGAPGVGGIGGEAADRAAAISDYFLGKTVVRCKDTPGFIANRIGAGMMATSAVEAFRLGLSAEEADAVLSAPFGIPRTGVFGLMDLIGIDVMRLVLRSLLDNLPADDRLQRFDLTREPGFRHMIESGLLGVKTKAGYFKRIPGGREREVMDFATLAYRPERPVELAGLKAAGKDLKALIAQDDKAGRYAWRVLSQTVLYAAEVAPEIADDVAAIDVAMQLGYNWQSGPFGLADRVGAAALAERLAKEGETVPPLLEAAASGGGFYRDGGRTILASDGAARARPRASGILILSDLKQQAQPVLKNGSAAVWDIGEGVACLELQTKANAFDEAVFELIEQAVDTVPKGFRALVIGNEHPSVFSAGANLALLLERIEKGDFAAIEAFIAAGQTAFMRLKYANFPVIGAGFGSALGGGCEVLLHSDAVVAHAELNAGLPEVSVGLIPGWGGSTQMLVRWQALLGAGAEPASVAAHAFDAIVGAKTSASALGARDLGILRVDDAIVMNRDRLLAEARAGAIALAAGYKPPLPPRFFAAGAAGKTALIARIEPGIEKGEMAPHTAVIAGILAETLTGGSAAPDSEIGETEILALERDAIAQLVRLPSSRDRMAHFLKTGKPLAN